MDGSVFIRLILIWIALSMGLLIFFDFGCAIQDAKQGISSGGWAPATSMSWLASPEEVSEIEEAFKAGSCDPMLRHGIGNKARHEAYYNLEKVCVTLNFHMELDQSEGIYEAPYTYAIFKKNQWYWYERILWQNVKARLPLWAALSAALLLILMLPVALRLI